MVGRTYISSLIVVMLCFSLSLVSADRLPNETPENQLFSIDTVLDATGAVDQTNSLKWVIASPGAIPTGILWYSQSIADVTYKDTILTNGGKLSENMDFGFDSGDQASGLYNLEAEKVLTYAGTEGAHMVGEEELILSVAGNWANVHDNIRCVFSGSSGIGVPAFCNIVSAKSSLININSAQVSAKGQLRSVSDTINSPTELSYRFAVTPDANLGSGFAEGTVSTVFAGSILEARNGNDYAASAPTWNKTSVENTWKDSTTVTGGIRNFQKAFGDPSYQSGILGTDPNGAFNSPTPSPTTEPAGTIYVSIITGSKVDDDPLAFTLTGPQNGSGSGSTTFSNMPAGYYTATMDMGSSTDSGTLSAGGTLTLTLERGGP